MTNWILYAYKHTARRPARRARPRRGGGCLPLTVAGGVMVGWLMVAFGWAAQTPIDPTAEHPHDLSAAQNAFNNGDLDSTVLLTSAIVNAQAGRTDAVLLLVRALVYRSYTDYNRAVDRQLALEIAENAARRHPADPDALAARALALQVNQRHAEAHRVASHALRVDPDHTMARVALALAYAGAGSFENALRESERAMTTADPRWRFDALRAHAITLSDTGRYTDAGRIVQQAIEVNSRLPLLYFERALYALQIGDFNTATVAYFQVLAQDAGNVKARLRLCELSSLIRETQTALSYCHDVTQRAPGWADGWHKLGREYYLLGDFASAQAALNRCTTLHIAQGTPPQDRPFECWYLQGQAAEQTGDCPAVHALYREFTEMVQQAQASGSRILQTWTYPPEGPPPCDTDPTGEREGRGYGVWRL